VVSKTYLPHRLAHHHVEHSVLELRRLLAVEAVQHLEPRARRAPAATAAPTQRCEGLVGDPAHRLVGVDARHVLAARLQAYGAKHPGANANVQYRRRAAVLLPELLNSQGDCRAVLAVAIPARATVGRWRRVFANRVSRPTVVAAGVIARGRHAPVVEHREEVLRHADVGGSVPRHSDCLIDARVI